VDQAATLDMAMATVDAPRAVNDDAAFLLRRGRTAEAKGLPLRVRSSWAGRPRPAPIGRQSQPPTQRSARRILAR
jgi:hypothetical protein